MFLVGCLLGMIGDTGGDSLAVRLFPDPPARLTEANCLLLRKGMSRLQVAALVGGRGTLSGFQDFPFRTPWARMGTWKGAEVVLTAFFDDGGKLTEAFYESQPGGELRVIPKVYEKP